ncbi:Uncharacterized protein CTYZ_00000824 [Cryptosporidium tyzzeri]|nr:Uncharacterized protein CTYZ_00000824 [Cryptosporidium tyzzeri]
MEEKLDLKSKYEKLRKKYAQLKQQTVALKESLEIKESEYKCLKVSFEELENTHKECISRLDASQYKETQLKREIEEIVCQLEQFKSHGNTKQDQPVSPNGKTGQGILTGLLPMNGVIMNFQKNEKLEEKVKVLQEELDLKISENEQLHIKEFDLKKQHQKAIEEHLANYEKLKNEIENLNLEINELKLKRGNEDVIIDEIKQLKEKDKANNQKINELLESNCQNENTNNIKLNIIRKLIPRVNLLQLEEEHSSWANICKQKNCFAFLKLESLVSEFLKKILIVVENWSKYINCYISKPSLQDKITERIYKQILILLKEGNKDLTDLSGVIFQNGFILEQNISESALSCKNDRDQFNSIEIKDILVERSISAMMSIKNALSLQIIAFKMEFHKLSGSKLAFEFQNENKKAIERLFIIIRNLRKYLPKLNCLFNFALNLGRKPDLMYSHTLWTNSFYVAFIELRREIKNQFDNICVEVEEKKQFFDFVKRILIEDVTLQDENISLSESFINSHKKIIELESMRKILHSKINFKIKNIIELISTELNDACKIFESLFFSDNITHPFFSETSKDIKSSFFDSIVDLFCLLNCNKESFMRLVSSLYQHPSMICQSTNNLSELQINMRETKSKLETAPPKITLPELHILNKRIEQLEESKNEHLKIINNLMNQLNSVNESSNLNDHKSDFKNDLTSTEIIPVNSSSEPSKISELKKQKCGNQPQKYIYEVFESQLREANETLENTVTILQHRINDLNDDIEVTRQSYDEQISLLSQHICSLSEKLALTDASTLSSFNQEILCYSCESWSTLDLILNKTKGACQKCKTKLLRLK